MKRNEISKGDLVKVTRNVYADFHAELYLAKEGDLMEGEDYFSRGFLASERLSEPLSPTFHRFLTNLRVSKTTPNQKKGEFTLKS